MSLLVRPKAHLEKIKEERNRLKESLEKIKAKYVKFPTAKELREMQEEKEALKGIAAASDKENKANGEKLVKLEREFETFKADVESFESCFKDFVDAVDVGAVTTLRKRGEESRDVDPMELVPKGKRMKGLWKEYVRPVIKAVVNSNETIKSSREAAKKYEDLAETKNKRIKVLEFSEIDMKERIANLKNLDKKREDKKDEERKRKEKAEKVSTSRFAAKREQLAPPSSTTPII